MIEIRTIKDVGSYQAKLIGPFTARQVVCLAVLIPIDWTIYNRLTPYLAPDICTTIMLLPAIVAYLIGWSKPYGMNFENFARSAFVSNMLAPSHRIYKTENRQEISEQYLSDLAALYIEAGILDSPKTGTSKKSEKHKKYKISPKAVL